MMQKLFEWHRIEERSFKGAVAPWSYTEVMSMPDGVLVRHSETGDEVDVSSMVYVPGCKIHIDADGQVCLIGSDPAPGPPRKEE